MDFELIIIIIVLLIQLCLFIGMGIVSILHIIEKDSTRKEVFYFVLLGAIICIFLIISTGLRAIELSR